LDQNHHETFATAARQLVSIHLDIDLGLEPLMIRELDWQDVRGPANVRKIALIHPTIEGDVLESGVLGALLRPGHLGPANQAESDGEAEKSVHERWT
jgi:hypothetical protein